MRYDARNISSRKHSRMKHLNKSLDSQETLTLLNSHSECIHCKCLHFQRVVKHVQHNDEVPTRTRERQRSEHVRSSVFDRSEFTKRTEAACSRKPSSSIHFCSSRLKTNWPSTTTYLPRQSSTYCLITCSVLHQQTDDNCSEARMLTSIIYDLLIHPFLDVSSLKLEKARL